MTIRFSELMAQRGEEPTSVLHELAAEEFEEDSQESLHESPFDDGGRQQMNGEGLTETNGYNPSDDEVRGDLGPTLDQIELPLETSVNEGQKESWSGMLETKAASKTFQFANTMDAILEDDRKLKSITSRLDDQIFDAIMRLERNFKRKMPWDMMPHKQKMGCASLDHLFQLPMVGRFDRAVLCSGGADQVVAREDWTVAMPFESKRLFAAKMALSDDELLCGALRKLRNIILFEPRDSQLGQSLLDKAGGLVGEDVLQNSLRDSLAGKAVGTVVKRIGDFNRFALWQVTENHERPLKPCEADFYNYLSHLQSIGAGATAGTSFLKSWNFLRFTVGAGWKADTGLLSGRVQGLSQKLFSRKRSLNQAPPIPAKYVLKMEQFVNSRECAGLRTVVGFLLFCIYACSRFGEAAKGSNADLEFQTAKETLLIELTLRNYKTATGDRKGVLLPLIASGNGLHRWSWGMAWRQARIDSGAAAGNYVMPADDQQSKGWRSRRMSTAEGSFWVKDVLTHLGMPSAEAEKYSTHSLKSTCLSWAAKSGIMTVQERLWLGHHQNEEGKMAITYARDALVAVLIKLKRIIDSIRDGYFDPDLSRVERVAMMTGIDVAKLPPLEEEKDEEQFLEPESEGDESDVEANENLAANPLPLNFEAVNPKIDREQLASSCSLLKHRLSGLVHILKEADKVACGRAVTGNYLPCESDTDFELCEQCRVAARLAAR